jgi:hypothetical protein
MSHVHIHAPAGVYIGQRRKRGHRRWETMTHEHDDKHKALIELVAHMKGYMHGRVIFCAEWYEPNVVVEIKQ